MATPKIRVGRSSQARRELAAWLQHQLADGRTLDQIGGRLGVSRQRVHQLCLAYGLDPTEGRRVAVAKRQAHYATTGWIRDLNPTTRWVVHQLLDTGVECRPTFPGNDPSRRANRRSFRVGPNIFCVHANAQGRVAPTSPYYRFLSCSGGTAGITHAVYVCPDGRVYVTLLTARRRRTQYIPLRGDGRWRSARNAWPWATQEAA